MIRTARLRASGFQGQALSQKKATDRRGACVARVMRTILLIILVILLLGALPTWPYSTGWGYYPSGGLGLIFVIVIILAVTGRL
jgi:sterol desaturase/sphingolipid hydroxylase (fatty acid hydroxylase superfamily)